MIDQTQLMQRCSVILGFPLVFLFLIYIFQIRYKVLEKSEFKSPLSFFSPLIRW